MIRRRAALAVVPLVVVGGWGRAPLPSPEALPVARAVHALGPPPGRTGGFGEPTCQQCHTEYGLNEPGGELLLEGLPDTWEAGRRYTVGVLLLSEEMAGAGFQLSARFADGTTAGRLAPGGPGVAVVDSAGVFYAQHTAAGTRPARPELARWSVVWAAPAGPGGPVEFDAAANSANGDDSPFGDLIYTAARVIPPARRAPASTAPGRRPDPLPWLRALP